MAHPLSMMERAYLSVVLVDHVSGASCLPLGSRLSIDGEVASPKLKSNVLLGMFHCFGLKLIRLLEAGSSLC